MHNNKLAGKTAFFLSLIIILIYVSAGIPAVRCFAAEDAREAAPSDEASANAPASAGMLSPNASGGSIVDAVVDPIGKEEGYSAILYDNQNGLPTSEANAIAQTGDGFLWIGGYGGLVRYDGEDFVRIDPVTGVGSVRCLYVDRQDRLWIGTNDTGIALLEKGEYRRWGRQEGLKSLHIRAITQEDNGLIYAATTDGIAMIDEDMNLRILEDPRLESLNVRNLRRGSDGLIYGQGNFGDLFTLKEGRVVTFIGNEECRVQGVLCMIPDPENPGDVYLGTETSEIYYGNLETNFATLGKKDVSPLSYINEFEVINGRVWILASNGAGVLEKRTFRRLKNVPMNNSIVGVRTDYEGNLWFVSTRQGVMKIVQNPFTDLFERFELQPRVVNTTCMAGNRLFVGTDTGLIVLSERGIVTNYPLKKAVTASGKDLRANDLIKMLDGCRIRSVIQDSRGRLWISTWRKYGLLCCENGEVTAFSEEEGLFSSSVRTICEREDGSILVANTGGVSVIENGRVTEGYGKEEGLQNTEVLTVAEGTDGDILIGSNGDGIYVIGKDGIRNIGAGEGLASDVVMRITRDPVRKIYWIVTGNSLAYMTEDYQVTTIKNFPYTNNFDLYVNSRGDVWVLCSYGIFIVPVEQMLENGEIEAVHYGRDNGLPCVATANSYSALTDRGDLYIAGATGVVKVNIEEPLSHINDLKVAVPYIVADGERIDPDEKGMFHIPSQVHRVIVYSYVYNYSLINPDVSYYLEGFDQKEVTVSRSDLAPVEYTNLPGGSYQFVIRLKDLMDRDSKTISIGIIKEKAFYERIGFYIALALLGAAVLAGIVRLYIRKRMQALEMKHREEAEKERIGSELQMANRIQESMLPDRFPAFPDRNEFDIYATMTPAREVGGDYYDFFLIDDDHLALVIADVSGKGVPAALFMMITKVIVQSHAMMGQSVGEILTKTNEAICSNNRVEMFVTIWLGVLEISSGRIVAANAGHEYPALKHGDRFELLKDRHSFVVGGMEGVPYREYTIDLKPGDRLFLYTDGVPEAADEKEELFGTGRMIDALNQNPEGSPEEILANVRKFVESFAGSAEQFDDMTMLCLEYKGCRKK